MVLQRVRRGGWGGLEAGARRGRSREVGAEREEERRERKAGRRQVGSPPQIKVLSAQLGSEKTNR